MKPQRKRKKPSQRQRRRYLVVVMQASRDFAALSRIIRQECNAEAKLIGFNDKRSKVMVCIPRQHLEKARQALKNAGFNLIGVSGTIRAAREKWG